MVSREDVHQLYKELSRELNSLSGDLAKGLGALRYATESNRGDIEELKSDMRSRLDRIQDKLVELEKIGAANEVRLKTLEESRRDHTGKIDTLSQDGARGAAVIEHEKGESKGRWALYTALATGALALIAQIVQAVLSSGGH